MEIKENAVYTTREVAELLKISLPTVKRMLKDKRLPSRHIGRQHRFLGKDLLKMLETGGTPEISPSPAMKRPQAVPRPQPPAPAAAKPAVKAAESPREERPAAPAPAVSSPSTAAPSVSPAPPAGDYLKGLSNLELRQRKYMLGKKVISPVLDDGGRTIVAAGAIVDDRIIAMAKGRKKLLELFKNLAHDPGQFGTLGRERESPEPSKASDGEEI